jgi:hypothetical protein
MKKVTLDEYMDKMDELCKLPVNIALEKMLEYGASVKVIGVNWKIDKKEAK